MHGVIGLYRYGIYSHLSKKKKNGQATLPSSTCVYLSSPSVHLLQAAKVGRSILGETNPINSAPGTIRGDFCQMVGRNVVHGSDSPESATKEIDLWFKPEEIHEYTSPLHDMIHE